MAVADHECWQNSQNYPTHTKPSLATIIDITPTQFIDRTHGWNQGSGILSGMTLAAELYNNDLCICCIQIDTTNKVYNCTLHLLLRISYVQA